MGVKRGMGGEERLQKDEILKRLRSGVAWSVSIGGQVKYVPLFSDYIHFDIRRFYRKLMRRRKGALQPITLGIKLRQGRKTVTVISGLEGFGIDIDDFAEELRKLCAGSASSKLSGISFW
jgi:translation initiation factor 2D